ncbi:MAG: DUF6314 family protein [Pseudomonadota bacterium]
MIELDDFRGRWSVQRSIKDRRAGRTMTAEGTANIVADEAGLLYQEHMTLFVPGQAPLKAERAYLWRATDAGIAVFFVDERPFHVIRLSDPKPEGRHFCAPDTYDVAYDFSKFPAWDNLWAVAGPAKNYVMHTHFHYT